MLKKKVGFIMSVTLVAVFFNSCFLINSKQEVAETDVNANDSLEVVNVPFKHNPKKIEYEIQVLKGTKVIHGVKKRFYEHGSMYSQIPYKKGKKHGTAYTYYQEYKGGKPNIWKEQPYTEGKLDGVCHRYHRNGKMQSEYEYKKGLPEIGLKEWKESGEEVKLPKLIVTKEIVNHQIHIKARMSNKAKNVKYYSGKLVEGKYVPKNQVPLLTKNGIGELTVPHTSTQKSVTVTAILNTRYRNTYYTAKTIYLE